jgi:hypothetical protein
VQIFERAWEGLQFLQFSVYWNGFTHTQWWEWFEFWYFCFLENLGSLKLMGIMGFIRFLGEYGRLGILRNIAPSSKTWKKQISYDRWK